MTIYDNTEYCLLIQRIDEIKRFIQDRPLYPRWLSIAKACEHSNLSPSTINRLINKGQLKASKVTGNSLIKVDWLDKYLEGK